MKAIIFNSGIGKRMGDFTKTHHKSTARLGNGETIFERQLRILSECGIKDFVVTTGPFADQLKTVAKQDCFSHLNFTFVENSEYSDTNYIYSMYLARSQFNDDALLLHGDLVFNRALVKAMLADNREDLALFNKELPLPEKDFKVRLENDKLSEVSVNIFGKDCFAFQPLYKLSLAALDIWTRRIGEYIADNNAKVYAENALNDVSNELGIDMFSYSGHYIDEVDTLADLKRVSEEIRQYDFDEQIIMTSPYDFQHIPDILKQNRSIRPMLVCDSIFDKLFISNFFDSLSIDFVKFSDFSPNPAYEEVVKGVSLFKEKNCDFVISIGGGSAIDTGKNIKLFSVLDGRQNYLDQDFVYSPVKHLAMPTTAGTGSESTRFSVLYHKGEKQSIAHDCIVPEYVMLEPKLLETLPEYQKKATMMDALCQCIEATWSVNTNSKCREFAKRGIQLVLANMTGYLLNNEKSCGLMQQAANLSGRAINISQTTAAHAMSYKLTSMYGIAHGHAVALCLSPVWRYMIGRTAEEQNDIVDSAFKDIIEAFRVDDINKALDEFNSVFESLELKSPVMRDEADLDALCKSVNPVRLKNNPVTLDQDTIYNIYKAILL